jgi:hypothetical protein
VQTGYLPMLSMYTTFLYNMLENGAMTMLSILFDISTALVPDGSLIERADQGAAHGVLVTQPVDRRRDSLRSCRVPVPVIYVIPDSSLIEGADQGYAHGILVAQPIDRRCDRLRGCRVCRPGPIDGPPHEPLGGVGEHGGGWGRRRRTRQMGGGSLSKRK